MSRARWMGRVGLAAIAAALAGCSLFGDGQCTIGDGNGINVWIRDVIPVQDPDGVTASGAATVVASQDPELIILQLDDGGQVRFSYSLPGDDAQTLATGQRVWAEVSGQGYFWVNHRIALFTVDATGGRGTLLVSVWATDDGTALAPGWTLSYDDGDCTYEDSCGPARGRDLHVTAPSGASATLAPGSSTDLDGYRVSNGLSGRYEGYPGCTDTALMWNRSGLVRL